MLQPSSRWFFESLQSMRLVRYPFGGICQTLDCSLTVCAHGRSDVPTEALSPFVAVSPLGERRYQLNTCKPEGLLDSDRSLLSSLSHRNTAMDALESGGSDFKWTPTTTAGPRLSRDPPKSPVSHCSIVRCRATHYSNISWNWWATNTHHVSFPP